MGVMVPRVPSSQGREGEGHLSLDHPLHSLEVLRGLSDLLRAPCEDEHFQAGSVGEVDVDRRADVLPPPVLGGREPALHLGGVMPVEQRHRSGRVRLGVPLALPRLPLPDEGAQGVRATPRIPPADPAVELREELRLQRNAQPDHVLGHTVRRSPAGF